MFNVAKKMVSPPAGTSGLVVSVDDDYCGVAADWSRAEAPVFVWGQDGWIPSPYQAATFRHSPREALENELRETALAGGGRLSLGEVLRYVYMAKEV